MIHRFKRAYSVRMSTPAAKAGAVVMGALLLGTISTAAPAASLVETAEARQEAPLFRPLITAAGQADLGQASLLALGPQLALLQVAAPVAGTLPTILDMVETVALNGPKASSLPWWSGMACPEFAVSGHV